MVQNQRTAVTIGAPQRNVSAAPQRPSVVEPSQLELVAHELRTPLAVMRIALDLLTAKPSAQEDDIAGLIARLRAGLGRIDALVDNLAVAAAVETGRADSRPDVADVQRALTDAAVLMEPLLARRGQEMILVSQTSCAAAIDPHSLGLILTNLLTNAGKYGPAGDRIEVGVDATSENVQISVSDHGPGVAQADQERIFQPYVRGGSAGNGPSGLGLGLYLVKSLAVAHGGNAGLSRRAGNGATFWVVLPARPSRS